MTFHGAIRAESKSLGSWGTLVSFLPLESPLYARPSHAKKGTRNLQSPKEQPTLYTHSSVVMIISLCYSCFVRTCIEYRDAKGWKSHFRWMPHSKSSLSSWPSSLLTNIMWERRRIGILIVSHWESQSWHTQSRTATLLAVTATRWTVQSTTQARASDRHHFVFPNPQTKLNNSFKQNKHSLEVTR